MVDDPVDRTGMSEKRTSADAGSALHPTAVKTPHPQSTLDAFMVVPSILIALLAAPLTSSLFDSIPRRKPNTFARVILSRRKINE